MRLLFTLLFSFITYSQICGYNGNVDLSKELCDFYKGSSFYSDESAEKGLNKILNVAGISKTFIMRECNGINNAAATTYKGVRYILYDKAFMENISNKSGWSNLSILAHEIGHHVNGHTLEVLLYANDVVKPVSKSVSRKQELEADYYSGFIMAKLGATLDQASQAIGLISSDADDSNSTHPSKNKRLRAIKNGYQAGYPESKVITKVVTKEVPAKPKPLNYEDYFYKAVDFHQKGNKSKALENYSQSIRLNSRFAPALNNRAILLDDYKRYNEALEDYNDAIALSPGFPVYVFNRAITKYNIDDFEGAISDINEGLKIDPENLKSIKIKAQSLFNLKKFEEAVILFEKLIENDPDESSFYLLGLCYGFNNDHFKAAKVFSKALEIRKDAKYLRARAVSYVNSNQPLKALEDYQSLILGDNTNFQYRFNRIKLLIQLNQKDLACEDLYNLKEIKFNKEEVEKLIKQNCTVFELKKQLDSLN